MTGLTEAVVGRLEELRGWTPAALERLEVGFDGDRVVFPVRDRSGEVVGLLRYAPNPERRSGPKMLADRGTPRELFPPPEDIGEDEADGTVWLVEGEPDAIRLWSLGLAAVAVPGAQNWRDEWASRFSGCRLRVVVCFDCDQAGRENANRAASAFVANGVDARVVDLDPGRDDGYDVTDFLAAAATPEQREEAADLMRQVAKAARLYEPERESAGTEANSAAADPTVTFAEFVARRDETAAAPLIRTEREGTMLPGGGLVILAAKVGDGKTTVTVELVLHAGAGLEYLGLLFPRPLNVLVIENEGPREAFRDKLESRLAAWEHDGQPRIWDEPAMWGQIRLSVEATRARLRAVVEAHAIDLVVADSLTRFGVRGNGTPEETREFIEWLTDLGLGRDLAFLLLHHPRSRPEPGEGELERLAGAWQPHADLILLLQKQDGDRARLSFPKTRWARGQRPASILAFDPQTEAFTYVADEQADERDLAGELATLMADCEWYTVSALRQPKEKGGVGAQYDAVVDALADNRFESVAGDHLGRRKDWTYHRLRPVSPGVRDGGDTHGPRVRGEAVSPSPPVRENTGGDPALDPQRSGKDDPRRPTSIQVETRTGAPHEVEQLADLVDDLEGEQLTSAAEQQEGPDVIDTKACPAILGWECPCGRERPNARTVVSLREPKCPFCGRAFEEEYRNTDNGGDAERAPSPAGGASA